MTLTEDSGSKALTWAYSEADTAWVTEALTLTGDTYLTIELKESGRVVIKRKDAKGRWPKIFISNNDGAAFRLRLSGENKDREIKLYTSTEPKTIEYANI